MSIGDGAHRDVAIREHAHEPVLIADRQRAHVERLHARGRLVERGIGTDTLGILGHQFVDLHDRTPLVGCLLHSIVLPSYVRALGKLLGWSSHG